MDFNTIENILGRDAVANLEAALQNAALKAGRHPRGAEAYQVLLIAYVAAAVITPALGAEERLVAATDRLQLVVDRALSLAREIA